MVAEAQLDKHFELDTGLEGYRWNDLLITPRLSDRLLAYCYERFDEEKLLPLIFHQGVPCLLEFLHDYINPHTYTMGAFVLDGEKVTLAGLGWINHLNPIGSAASGFVRADCGEAFFREFWHANRPQGFAKLMFEWGFDNLRIDAMSGVTPADNRPAVLFAHKLGMQVVGPVDAGCVWQGELAPAYISTMSRTRWAEKRPWKG